MIDTVDIYRSAFVLIQHAEGRAFDEAMRLAHEKRAGGDRDGSRTWRAIARVIDDLECQWQGCRSH